MKHIYRYYRVFSYDESGGNGAVVFLDQGYTEKQMQQYAQIISLSEIAFVKKVEDRFCLRFFTPNKEIEMCGHATLAAVEFIKETYKERPEKVWAGTQSITVHYLDPKVYISLGEAEFVEDFVADKALGEALSIDSTLMGYHNMKPRIYRSGIADILLPVHGYEQLMSLKLKREQLIALSRQYNVVGVHAFTMKNEQIYARNFAPLYEIDEEYATGTSNNSLVKFMMDCGMQIRNKGSIIQGDGKNLGLVEYLIEKSTVYIGGRVAPEDTTYKID